MSNGKDQPGKGPVKGAPEPVQPKKPTAVIDLKATEIPMKDGKPAEAASAAAASSATSVPSTPAKPQPGGPQTVASASAAMASSAASAGKPGETKPSDVKPMDAKTTGPKPADMKPQDTKTGTTTGSMTGTTAAKPGVAGSAASATSAASNKPQPSSTVAGAKAAADAKARETKPAAPAPARSGGSRFVSALTHATAGIVGGLIALLAADTVGPQLGLKPSEAMEQAKATQASLVRLEADMKARAAAPQVDPALTQKMMAAEKKLADLEKAGAELAALKRAQEKLIADTEALTKKIAVNPDPGAQPVDAVARLAKLEDQLGLLSTAAGTDPQRGRIPQIAAVTGKVADLEVALATGLAGVRKSVTQEIDARLGTLTDAAETAKAGVTRLDRDLTQAKSDAAAAAKRADEQIAAVRTDIDSRLKTVAKTDDVKSSIEPVAKKVASLETTVQAVVKSEGDRKADAERVVLSLELGNLKRAIDRGAPYAAELDTVKRVSAGKLDLAALEATKGSGLATTTDLARDFRTLAHSVIEADATPTEGSVVDRLFAGAKSIVRVRKTDAPADDKSTEGVVARMENALKSGQLTVVLDEAKKLSAQALTPAKAWLERVETRAKVDKAIAAVDEQLKSSLAVKGAN